MSVQMKRVGVVILCGRNTRFTVVQKVAQVRPHDEDIRAVLHKEVRAPNVSLELEKWAATAIIMPKSAPKGCTSTAL